MHVLTDHKSLKHALSSSSSSYSPRETRHVDFTSQFTSDIRHVDGKDNPVADALSRMDGNAITVPLLHIDYALIATAQQNDPDLSQLNSTSLHLQALSSPYSTDTILRDTASPCPYIPEHFRNIDQFHNHIHLGILQEKLLRVTPSTAPENVLLLLIMKTSIRSYNTTVELANKGGLQVAIWTGITQTKKWSKEKTSVNMAIILVVQDCPNLYSDDKNEM